MACLIPAKKKLQFTPFWGGPKLGCSDGLRAGIVESHNFLVLGPIMVEFHIRAQLIQSYPMEYGWWSCGKEKLLICLEAHHTAQLSEIFLFLCKKFKDL